MFILQGAGCGANPNTLPSIRTRACPPPAPYTPPTPVLALLCSGAVAWSRTDLDCGNVIWSMQAHLQSAHGVHVPWLSWIDDQVSSCSSPPSPPSLPSPPSPATAQPPSPATAQTLRRVYAYRAPEGAEISARDAVWASPAELEADAAGWVRMWQTSTDGQGRVVKRGMGFAIREGNRLLAGTYNNAGVCEGETWLCAEFDAHGALRRPSRKVADAGS